MNAPACTRRTSSTLLQLLAVCAALALSSACDKVDHENIDKWRNTQQGPAKLEKALKDKSLDIDLRAHAAEALVTLGEVDKVKTVVGVMSTEERDKFFEKLTPRLWNVAKPVEADQAPVGKQARAKDAMFDLRSLAEGARRDELDDYLIDWLTAGGFYEERSQAGERTGDLIIRSIGVRAGPRMAQLGQDLLKTQSAKEYVPIGKQTLRGIAYTGAPEAIGFLIEVIETTHPQENLQSEAIYALNHVYVEDMEEPRADSLGLVPYAKRLEKLALNKDMPGEVINISYELLLRIGPPACLPPLVALATQRELNLMLRAIDFSMRCGGADAIIPVAEAMSTDGSYSRGVLEKYIVNKIPAGVVEQSIEPATTLLTSKSWVGRWIGVEILGKYGKKADAAKVRALASDKTVLRGFWGEQDPDDKKTFKAEPTLGKRAVEVADLLEKKS